MGTQKQVLGEPACFPRSSLALGWRFQSSSAWGTVDGVAHTNGYDAAWTGSKLHEILPTPYKTATESIFQYLKCLYALLQ
jgi:hypothetical protein